MSLKRWSSRFPLLACAVAATLVFAGCSGSTPTSGKGDSELTIAGPKDNNNRIHKILDTWNTAHPDHKASYVELPTASDAMRQQMIQSFLARSSAYDIVLPDDTWTAEFASKKWLMELPTDQFPMDKMFPASVAGGVYGGKQYALPYTASSQLLYYRKDLVTKAPATWADLIADCSMPKAKNTGCYSGQYAQYEGLTVGFLTAVASVGGKVLSNDGTQVLVDTPAAKKGLDFLVNGFRQGYIPKEAITYKEDESRRAFQSGKLVFMTNYSNAYEQANTAGPDTKVAGKVGIARVPGLTGPGTVATGGHMIAVSQFSKHQTDAVDFVKFFTSEDNAKQLLIKQAGAPVYKNLYTDASLAKQFPFLPVLSEELLTAVARPRTTNYAALSLVIQKNVYAALQGSKSSQQAITEMASQLKDVVAGK